VVQNTQSGSSGEQPSQQAASPAAELDLARLLQLLFGSAPTTSTSDSRERTAS